MLFGFVAHGLQVQLKVLELLRYECADENGFAFLLSSGTSDSWGDNFWNVGYNFHSGVTVDDVGFIVSLASYLQSTYS